MINVCVVFFYIRIKNFKFSYCYFFTKNYNSEKDIENTMEITLENFRKHVDALAAKLNIDHIDIDENNDCYLVFDDKYYVKCSYLDETKRMRFLAYIGLLPSDKEEFYCSLLERCAFWKDTAGGNLSIDPTDGTLILSHYKDLKYVDNEIFYKTLESFVNAMEYWDTKCLQEWIATKPAESSGSAAGMPGGPAGMMMFGA